MGDSKRPDGWGSSFWTTLPGILTGIAGLVGAMSALLIALKEANLIGGAPVAGQQAASEQADGAGEAVLPDGAEEPVSADEAGQAVPPDGAAAPESLEPGSGFQGELQSYLQDPGYKALFVAVNGEGDWIAGSSSDAITQAAADAVALTACEAELAASDVEGVCNVYARGEEIVWESAP